MLGFGILKKTIILLVSLLLTYKFIYLFAETFYFDKFFYYKSLDHGYWTKNNNQWELFGERSRFINKLKAGDNEKFNSEEYVVVVIGDSYIWGQGVLYNETFPKMLEYMLNLVRPTKVISIAECGDTIVDYKAHYDWAKKQYDHVDMWIFSLVDNDLMLNDSSTRLREFSDLQYGNYVKSCLDINSNNNNMVTINYSDRDTASYDKILKSSWENPINICVLSKISRELPDHNALYISFGDLWKNNGYMNTYKKILGTDKYILDTNGLRETSLVAKIFMLPKFKKLLNVSKADGHPSKISNYIFAKLVFDKLIKNEEYGFLPIASLSKTML